MPELNAEHVERNGSLYPVAFRGEVESRSGINEPLDEPPGSYAINMDVRASDPTLSLIQLAIQNTVRFLTFTFLIAVRSYG